MVTITHIITDLSVGGEGGLLLPSSGVVLPPLVLSLHLHGLLGLLSSILNRIFKNALNSVLFSLTCGVCSAAAQAALEFVKAGFLP